MHDDHEAETFGIKYYLDHRRGDLDNYPVIALCDACADGLGGNLGGCYGPSRGPTPACDECDLGTEGIFYD